MASNPSRTPNLFNLNPEAFRLNRGGHSLDRIQRINRGVGINGEEAIDYNSQARIDAKYSPVLDLIRKQQQDAVQRKATYDSNIAGRNQAISDATHQAGSDISGNIALRAIPVLGPILSAASLVGKGLDYGLREGSAINDFVSKAISAEAGDAVNTVAEIGGGVADGISMTGNAIGDVISGGVIGDFGGRMLTNAVGDVFSGVFGGFGGGDGGASAARARYETTQRVAQKLYSQWKSANPDVYGNAAWDSFSKSISDPYGYASSMSKSRNADWKNVNWHTTIRARSPTRHGGGSRTVYDQFDDPTNAIQYLMYQDYLPYQQKQVEAQKAAESEAAAQREAQAAIEKEQKAAQRAAMGVNSPSPEYDIPTQPIALGDRLGNTSLYSNDLHQQMLARNK